MAWTMSTGIDISHYQTITDYAKARAAVDWVQIKVTDGAAFLDPVAVTHHRGFAGRPRGPYHFARTTAGIREQVAHFLARKAAIGPWERPDMLDVEPVEGEPMPTGPWVRDLIAEYRRQSGRRLVLVYTPVDPAGWWDPGCVIWRARYRGTGLPSPDQWAQYLGWSTDHPGLGILQWSETWPLPGGPLVDRDSQRISLEDDMGDYNQGDRNKLDALCNAVLGSWDPGKSQAGTAPLPGSVAAGVDDLVARPAPAPVGPIDYDQLADALLRRIAAAGPAA